MMWRARFFQIMPEIQEKYPNYRWVFLTLTVKNCPIEDLRENLSHMSKAWNKFIKYSELSAVQGLSELLKSLAVKMVLLTPIFIAYCL